MKNKVFFGASILLLLGFLIGSASAQLGGNLTIDDEGDFLVNVNISTVTMIDVQPYALAWSPVPPGGVGDNETEVLGPGYFAIQVENIGSHNITQVWFNATYPDDSPFGTADPLEYDAGNFVTLSATPTKNAPNGSFYFINRVEYNETTELVYMRDASGNIPPDTTSYTYGRFRNNSQEYFWMINAPSGNCAGATWIRLGNISHTRTQTGTTNFQTGAYTEIALNGWGAWRVGHIDSGPLTGYEVAVNGTCATFFSHWNRDAPFDSAGTEAVYAYNGDLTAGASFAMAIKVFVPYGVYEGQSGQGTVWAIVTGA